MKSEFGQGTRSCLYKVRVDFRCEVVRWLKAYYNSLTCTFML